MNKKKAIGSLILNIFTFLSVLGCMIYIFIVFWRSFPNASNDILLHEIELHSNPPIFKIQSLF
ncbi:MAG: hypothetical protein IKN46_00385, partial [Acholeplasmatales bacterium]|nr:hypothetical protein [Acholeplasmatales bacterium]